MTTKVSINGANVRGLADRLKSAKEKLQAGWMPGENYRDGLPVATVAAWNEFGTKTAPARPFMRPAVADNQSKWSDIFAGYARQWINGQGSYADVLGYVGLSVEGDIKNAIVGGDHLALSPITLALRKLRNDNAKIGGKLVGAVAAAIAEGKTGAGELGEPFANQDPLRETGVMLAALTHEVS